MLKDLNLVIAHIDPGATFSCNEYGEIITWASDAYPEMPTPVELEEWRQQWLESKKIPDWDSFIAAFQVFSEENYLYSDFINLVSKSGFVVQNLWTDLKILITSPKMRTPELLASAITGLVLGMKESGNPLDSKDIEAWNMLIEQFGFPQKCKLSL